MNLDLLAICRRSGITEPEIRGAHRIDRCRAQAVAGAVTTSSFSSILIDTDERAIARSGRGPVLANHDRAFDRLARVVIDHGAVDVALPRRGVSGSRNRERDRADQPRASCDRAIDRLLSGLGTPQAKTSAKCRHLCPTLT